MFSTESYASSLKENEYLSLPKADARWVSNWRGFTIPLWIPKRNVKNVGAQLATTCAGANSRGWWN